jgi:hypothetical protein
VFLHWQNLLYGKGAQSIYWIPRHNGEVRVATSPTYAIYDYREGEGSPGREIVAAGTAATVGSETQALTAAAGPSTADPRRITVGAVTSFTEGHVYLLIEGGRYEAFTLDRIDATNKYLYSQAPLRNAWTTAAIVDAVMLQGTFPAAEAADESEVEGGGGPYGSVWSYTVDGVLHNDFQLLWLARYSFVSIIDETDIKRADPKLAAVLRAPYSLADLCILATEEYCADLEASGKDPTLFYPSTRHVAVRHKALEIAYRWKGKADDLIAADRHREDYERKMNSILTGIPPFGTAEIDRATDTAPAGTSPDYTPGILRRA